MQLIELIIAPLLCSYQLFSLYSEQALLYSRSKESMQFGLAGGPRLRIPYLANNLPQIRLFSHIPWHCSGMQAKTQRSPRSWRTNSVCCSSWHVQRYTNRLNFHQQIHWWPCLLCASTGLSDCLIYFHRCQAQEMGITFIGPTSSVWNLCRW